MGLCLHIYSKCQSPRFFTLSVVLERTEIYFFLCFKMVKPFRIKLFYFNCKFFCAVKQIFHCENYCESLYYEASLKNILKFLCIANGACENEPLNYKAVKNTSYQNSA